MTHPAEERLKTALSEKYEIEEKLGEGGMAVVYLARDRKHGRHVAVKVLRPELASALGPDRFLREIQVTAGLSHPHILPLYDSGEADGFLFYVMPYLPGESLSDLIKREKQLSLGDAIRIAREVAEGLGHAHSHGLIHRDIKPDNIMLSGGHAVIADFGISRALSEAGGDKLTQTGMAIGTPAYMAPEQAAGDENLDARADIYALGCVLYEMLIGDVPFTGPTPIAVMARHTMDHLTAPSIMRDSITPEIEDVIYCAMAKTPADRFRTATEMAEALTAVDSGGLAKVRKTAAHLRHTSAMRSVPPPPAWRRPAIFAAIAIAITTAGLIGWQMSGNRGTTPPTTGTYDLRQVAVLYFQDRTGRDMGHVADGLTEGLIDQLSQVQSLNVISRNGVEPFRDGGIPRDSIASALRAGTIIDGAIESERERIRVTAYLVDGESGATIRSETFDLPSEELLAVQDSAAVEVSMILREWLGEEVRLRNQRSRARNVAAWTLQQRAEKLRKDARVVFSHDRVTAIAMLSRADSILAAAEAADPDWVEPSLTRGDLALSRALAATTREEHQTWLDSAMIHSNRASQLIGDDARVSTLQGRITFERWSRDERVDPSDADAVLDSAQAFLDAAVRSDPNQARAYAELYYVHYAKKDVVSAVLAARRAYETDAYLTNASTIINQLFSGFYDNAQFREARRWCAEGRSRFPDDRNFVQCQLFLMIAPDEPPAIEEAWMLLARYDSLTSAEEPLAEFHHRLGLLLVGGVVGRAGLTDSAEQVMQRAQGNPQIDPGQELPGYEAVVRTSIGDTDAAIELLKRYVAANPHHSFEVGGNIHWWWAPLRDNPEFQDVMALRR